MSILSNYFFLFVHGALVTVAAWAIALSISSIIGTALGIISCRHLAHPLIGHVVRIYTFIAKGIPAYVHILIAYFVLPCILPLHLSGFTAAVCALGFCSGGYVTEIIRAGMNAVPSGQWYACAALGYSHVAAIRRIIAPQALRIIMPTLVGEGGQLLKSTSLLATIGVTELTRVGMNIISRELNPAAVYVAIACIYLCFSAIIHTIAHLVTRRMGYDYR